MKRQRGDEIRQFTSSDIARMWRVPEHMIGLPSPWYRRLWQRLTRPTRVAVTSDRPAERVDEHFPKCEAG